MKLLISFVALSMLASLLLRWVVYPASFHRFFRRLGRVALWLVLLLLIMAWLATPAATANVEFLKEAEQWIYQSQIVLPDKSNNSWEMTALKQMDGENRGFYLRLVTDSPTVQLDAVQPLTIATSAGEKLSASNVTRQQFVGDLPDPQVGQYDLQGVLYKLGEAGPVELRLATRDSRSIALPVPSEIVEEWFSVGACEYLVCAPHF